MLINFDLNENLAEKFEIAVTLNREDKNEVASRLLSKYIAETFENEARAICENTSSIRPNYLDPEDINYAKAKRKIPIWARKNEQTNHKIIKAFFQLEKEHGVVTVSALEQRCRDHENHHETFVNDFKGNFAQLKTDAGNSHGKVFVVGENNIVTIWEEVKTILIGCKNFFINNQ